MDLTLERMTAKEVQDAVNEALAIENKIRRLRALHDLRGHAPHSELRQIIAFCDSLSQEIIEDTVNWNGLRASRYQTVCFSRNDGIVSPKRMKIKTLDHMIQTPQNQLLIQCSVSQENLADHGHIYLDRDEYAVIIAAPYGTKDHIIEKFKRVVGDYPVELEFSPGDGHANHHSPGFARGIAIRSAKAKPMIWPDYYYEYPESIG